MKFYFLSELFVINIVTGVDSCKSEEEEPGRNIRDDRAGAIILIKIMIRIRRSSDEDAFDADVHQDDNKDDADEDDFDVDVC